MKKIISILLFVFAVLFMSNTVEAAVVKSGSIPCSEGVVSWTLDDNGILTISGEGTISLNESGNDTIYAYWSNQDASIREDAKEIVIESPSISGIKFVENDANWLFKDFDNVTEIWGLYYFDFTETDWLVYAFSMESLESINEVNKGGSSGTLNGEPAINHISFSSKKLTNTSYMFYDCKSLGTVHVTFPVTVTNINAMFEGCSNLKSCYIGVSGNGNEKAITDAQYLFRNCALLESVTFNSVSMSDDVNVYHMCTGAGNLKTIKTEFANTLVLPLDNIGCTLADTAYSAGWVLEKENGTQQFFEGGSKITANGTYKAALQNVKFVFHDYLNGETFEDTFYLNGISLGGWVACLSDSPAKSGYSLDGYYADAAFTEAVEGFAFKDDSVQQNKYFSYEDAEIATTGLDVYCKWTPTKYSIRYNLNNGTNNSANPSMYTIEDADIVLQNPTRSGYTFNGWYTSSGFAESSKVTMIDTSKCVNVTLYAKWECNHETTTLKNYVAPTCCTEGYSGDEYCVECSMRVGTGEKTSATGIHSTTVTGKVEPTCVTEGNTGKTYCTNSGNLLDEGRVVPATGIHTIELHDAKEATCTEEGYTGDEYCTVCESTIKVGTVIPMEEHVYDNGEITKQPTETETGIRTFTCINCDATKTETLPVIVKECIHEKTEVKNVKEATCKLEGYTGDTYCVDCGALVVEGSAIPKTNNHNYDKENGVVLVEPTTEKEGSVEYTCTVCGDTTTKVIAKLPVTPDNTTNPGDSGSNGSDTGTNGGNQTVTDPSKDKQPVSDSTDTKKAIKNAKKAKASISKLTNKKGKKIVVKVKKVKGYKYQIKVSTSKKFKKSVKTYKTSKISYTVKRLKKGKKYYVKVRTYKVIDGKSYYGKWSKVKWIKIKK